MGQLLRRYCTPSRFLELIERPTKAVRHPRRRPGALSRQTGPARVDLRHSAAHRRMSMLLGIPEKDGLRCPYHDGYTGATEVFGAAHMSVSRTLTATFKDRIRLTAYPVQELGGLVFAYLGPEPAPLVPSLDLLVRDGVLRDIGAR